jgi:hypothetical protein
MSKEVAWKSVILLAWYKPSLAGVMHYTILVAIKHQFRIINLRPLLHLTPALKLFSYYDISTHHLPTSMLPG